MTHDTTRSLLLGKLDKLSEAEKEEVVGSNDERAVEAIAGVVPTYHPWKNKGTEQGNAKK